MSLFLFQKHKSTGNIKIIGIYFDKYILVDKLKQNANQKYKYYIFDTDKENSLLCQIVDNKLIIDNFSNENPIQHLLNNSNFSNTDTIKYLKNLIKLSKKNNLYQTNILFDITNFQALILNRLSNLYDNIKYVDTFEKYNKNVFGCICHLKFDNENSANKAIKYINKLGLNVYNAGDYILEGIRYENSFIIVNSAYGNLNYNGN